MDRIKRTLRLLLERIAQEVRKQIRNAKSFLRRSKIWFQRDLLSEKLFLSLVLIPLSTAALCAWLTLDWMATSGFLLQLFGSFVVVRQVFRSGLLSGNESVSIRFRTWITNMRRWGRPQHHVLHVDSMSLASMIVGADLIVNAGPNDTIERRIEILEEDRLRVRELIKESKKEMEGEFAKLKEEFKRFEEKADRVAHKESLIAEEVRSLTDMELCAVVWLLFGLLLSNVPVVLRAF